MQSFFSTEAAWPLLRQWDVPTVVALSKTCKAIRSQAAFSLIVQFEFIVAHFKKQYENNPTPSLDRRIYVEWLFIKNQTATSRDKSLIFTKIHTISNTLKLFYEVIPCKRRADVLMPMSPSFISVMIAPCKDAGRWNDMSNCEKINSVINELSKVHLYENLDSLLAQSRSRALPFAPQGAAVFVFLKDQSDSLCCLERQKCQNTLHMCYINANEDKWKNITRLYEVFFINRLEERKHVLIPFYDLRLKIDRYTNMRSQIEKMEEFRADMTESDAERLKSGEYCLRFSNFERDEFRKPELILSFRTTKGKMHHISLEEIYNIFDLDQLRARIQQAIKYLNKFK